MHIDAAVRPAAKRYRILWIAGGLSLLLLICGAFFLVLYFPFRRDKVISRVQRETGASIDVGAFRHTWFPPGFSAERIRLTDRGGNTLAIDAITLEGSYVGLLRRPAALKRIYARGVNLSLPNRKALTLSGGTSKGGMAVGEIQLDDAVLDLPSGQADKPPLEFVFHKLLLRNAGSNRRTSFELAAHNPKPPGEVFSKGNFGPFDARDPGRTPLAGTFTFNQADLTVDHGVSGIMSAAGKFDGRLGQLNCSGTVDVPQFHVFGSAHTVHVAGRYGATVDALRGNASLNQIVAHFNATTILASGSVASEGPGRGKVVTLNTSVNGGRIEDLLILFARKSAAPMRGPVNLTAKFTMPSGPPDFLTKLSIDGQFDIRGGLFTNERTQTPIDRLSASAEGESKQQERADPTLVTADIRGNVIDRDGVARLPNVVFETAGIYAQLAGTFALRRKQLDFRGILQTRGKPSDTTSGLKAVMLKAVSPLWHKKADVKTIPFTITGQASQPVFRLALHR